MPDIKSLNLGLKIRKLREELGKSREELARMIRMDAGLLERIEKNELAPPIATLINIANHTAKDLEYFMTAGVPSKPFSIVKKGKAQQVPRGKNPLHYVYHQLAPDKSHKQMEPFLVEFRPSKEKTPLVTHDGEEFLYVLSGTIECRIQNKKFRIQAGDSLYFESTKPHVFTAIGRKPAKAVVVLYPH